MPEGMHPLDELPRGKGWVGIGKVDLDGKNWTLDFASKYLDVPEALLRVAVKYTSLSPAGTLNMREYRSQGRTPRAYPAGKLIIIAEGLEAIRDNL